MRKLTMLLTLILSFLFVPYAFAVTSGTTPETMRTIPHTNHKIYTIYWEASDTDAGVTTYHAQDIAGYMLDKIIVDPHASASGVTPSGTTPMSANWDVVVRDDTYDYDVLGGNGVNLSGTTTEERLPFRSNGVYGSVLIGPSGASVYISGNINNSATGKIHFICRYEGGQ